MIIIHQGITYLHLAGRLWIDWKSWIAYDDWIKAGMQHNAPGLYWKEGICPSSINPYRAFTKPV